MVRAALMRSTLHLMTANDHQRFRMPLQPALDRALRSFFGKRARELDIVQLVAIAKPFIEAEPRSTGDIRGQLKEAYPDADGDAMAYAVRNNLPLIQVAPGGAWGSGSRATYTTAESVLGPIDDPADLRTMMLRYLAAFGPASIMDFQAWVGITKLKHEVAAFQDELTHYQDEDGKDLFDHPDLLLIPAETDAPVRFLPEYDNLLVSHADRRRIIADDDRQYVFLSAARVMATIVVDGFVSGIWKTERNGDTATLIIEPFRPLSPDVRDALMTEGDALIRFIEDNASDYAVRFSD